MRSRRLLLAGLASGVTLAFTACHGGPTSPKPGDTFKLVGTMSNASGGANMVDAEVSVDNGTVFSTCDMDATGQCINSAVATFAFTGLGSIGPGNHTISFIVFESTTSHPVTYTISGCDLQVFDQTGKLLKNISFPTLTQTVDFGGTMSYSFTL
jgi:hypothetical protein